MQLFPALRFSVLIAAVCLCVQGQNPQSPSPPGKEPQTEGKGMPPRATPGDYQAQEQAGTVTIAAEFQGHAVPTLQGNLTTEDYVVVEVGLFGPAGARVKLSFDDFSLRINGKKALPGEPYGVVLRSLKDPEWVPPEEVKPKSKTSFGSGDEQEGGGAMRAGKEPPVPVKIPIEVQRAMAERVRKATLPEGDRPLPQAGLLFFQCTKVKGIHTVERIYAGPAGKATLTLQP